MSQQLDRGRPLWEMWVVEGLEDDRFALISKTHHCMIDGISGADLISVLMRTEPDDARASEPWTPRPHPSRPTCSAASWRAAFPSARAGAARGGRLRDLAAGAGQLGETRERLGLLRSGVARPPTRRSTGHRPLPPLRLGEREPGRREGSQEPSRRDGQRRRPRHGRRCAAPLLPSHADLGSLDFRVVVPVSVRTASEQGTLGNRVAGWLLSLPIQEDDPRVRRERISATTAHLKASNQAHGVEALAKVADLFDPILTLGVRLAARLHPYNLIVSNVPGPQLPLYLLGARMREGYPVVPLFEYQGLGIATFSYDGMLYWAVNACWDLVPDLHVFVESLEESFRELQATAHDTPAEPPAPRKRARVRRTNAGAAR